MAAALWHAQSSSWKTAVVVAAATMSVAYWVLRPRASTSLLAAASTLTSTNTTTTATTATTIDRGGMAAEGIEIDSTVADPYITLKDGRRLFYAIYGKAPKEGNTVLLFHGLPGSRLFRHPDMERIAEESNACLIVLERPGFGYSTPLRRPRRVIEYAWDVAELIDELGIDRFAVAGFSMGAIFALGCAYAAVLRDRLCCVTIISGSGDYNYPRSTEGMMKENRLMNFIIRHFPNLSFRLMSAGANFFKASIQSNFEYYSPLPEVELLNLPFWKDAVAKNVRETFRQGIAGGWMELHCYLNEPLGFSMVHDQPHTSNIYLHHSDSDQFVPLPMAQNTASCIAGSRLQVYPGLGHFGVFSTCWRSVVATSLRHIHSSLGSESSGSRRHASVSDELQVSSSES